MMYQEPTPYRETLSTIRFTADMAIQNVIGDSFRGATWVSIHNGGGSWLGRGYKRWIRHGS
jgi:urocanate hydratase